MFELNSEMTNTWKIRVVVSTIMGNKMKVILARFLTSEVAIGLFHVFSALRAQYCTLVKLMCKLHSLW